MSASKNPLILLGGALRRELDGIIALPELDVGVMTASATGEGWR